MNTPTPTPRTDSEITLTGTYTCTHHNDAERTACPVCLVTELTAERDQLRAEVKLWEAKCHDLIAPHYILDPCLRAQKFRDALAYHPVLT